MQTTVRVLNVFLASPDDVKPERAAAETLVSDLNRILGARLGWNVWLHKWEDTTPTFGRPQEIINKAVDNCALFIGLLWERWGQPTGRYSSGFEEEYERARARRKEGEEPEIWLVFKTVDPEKLKDPGPQLSKVLEFHRTQTTLGEVLFKEIGDLNDWKTKLYTWLLDYVLTLHAASSQPAQPPASAPQPESLEASTTQAVMAASEGVEVPKQLLHVAQSLTKVVRSGNLEFSRQDTSLLQEFDVARLFLLSATWMFRRYTGDTLGIHEMNLLYKHRERLEGTQTELFQLFRTLVVDTGSVIPGWYWFREIGTPEAVRDWILSLATHDSTIDVRRRALELLRTARIRLPKELWPSLPLLDDSETIRIETYEYLGFIGDENTASLLAEIASTDEPGDSSSAALEARLSIVLRLRPAEAFSEIIESGQHVSDKRLREMESFIAIVGDDILVRGVENQWEQVRKLSIKELARRRRFSQDLAEKLAEDPSVAIRELAFTELARQGQQLDLQKVRKSLSDESASKGALTSLSSLLGGRTQNRGTQRQLSSLSIEGKVRTRLRRLSIGLRLTGCWLTRALPRITTMLFATIFAQISNMGLQE